ncbi:MAG: dynamin family protein [Chitinispirillaceae bacterium]|nr:dynamin family protein [Chitinispirillaceae bacterium]
MGIETVLSKITELRTLVNKHSSLQHYNDHLNNLYESVHSKEIYVSFFGEFSSGKSSLINAILGNDILPTDVLPETSKIYEIRFRQKTDSIEIEYKDGKQQFFSGFSWIKEQKDNPDVTRVKVFTTSCAVPDGIVLVDIPGLSSLNEGHQKALEEYLPKSDAIIITIDISQPVLTKNMQEFINDLKLFDKPYYMVVTKSDMKPPQERDEVMNFVKGIKDIPISGLALTSAKNKNIEELSNLFSLIAKEKEKILEQSSIKALKQLCNGIINEIEGQIKTIQMDGEKYDEELDKIDEEIKKIQLELREKIDNYSKKYNEVVKKSKEAFLQYMQESKPKLVSVVMSTKNPDLDEKKFTDEFNRYMSIASRRALLHHGEHIKMINKDFINDLNDMFEAKISYSTTKRGITSIGSEVATIGTFAGMFYIGSLALSTLASIPAIGIILSSLGLTSIIVPGFLQTVVAGVVGRVLMGSSLKKILSGIIGKFSDITTKPMIEKQIDDNINNAANEFEKMLITNKEETILKIEERLRNSYEKMLTEKEKVKEEVMKMRTQKEDEKEKTIQSLLDTKGRIQEIFASL